MLDDLELFAAAAVGHGDIAVLVVGDDLEIKWASPAARRVFDGARGALPDLVDVSDAAAAASFLDRVGNSGGSAVRFVCSVPVDGSSPKRVELVGRDKRDVPELTGYVVVAHDVTTWAELEDQSRNLLYSDALTGLSNRFSLLERLAQAVGSASLDGPRPAVLCLDLDAFKRVNDDHGHHAGDSVLRLVASRIAAVVGTAGTSFRVGSDEFAVLLDRTLAEEASRTAERILESVSEPIQLEASHVRMTASIGVADLRDRRRPEGILRDADAAMYRAKASGGGRVVSYCEDLDDWALVRKREAETLAMRLEVLRQENQALAEAVTVDSRTGLPNSAAFESDHATLHARFLEEGVPYTLVLIDIDRFHGYNSRYLYLAGNRTIRSVADAISTTVRHGDRAYRYGGEEFTVLMPGAGPEEGVAVAERIRATVQALRIEHLNNAPGVVTVTAGVVTADSRHATADQVFEAVNHLLLRGKEAGRNQVVGPEAGR
ncbi:MAG TPA: diguanylate cyclase [Acidimicrobiales bacterium]|nr:diguanylate cyclase [Acidimicrobiales bacterium]